ncbi:MAG: radical SAM protein [Deltaproteobacteria bacterium]|nr:radical SAM protein [Deltaproteobacteria bacterium]
MNYGFCNTCQCLVPVSHLEKDGRVYLTKECAQCGLTQTLISSDAKVWNEKRHAAGYRDEDAKDCTLNCLSCKHGQNPMIVFVDVTNRCNLNCPICVANISSMGFSFEPPLAYFEKIFDHLATFKPVPSVKLFGGEPTVRDDLIDIINLAHSRGISTNVVTNGLRLADEEYCRKLLATGTKPNISFDGRDEDIYKKFRGNRESYRLKLKALENIRKYTQRKITLMCVVAKGISDHLIADLVHFCHENADFINALQFLPIIPTWKPGEVEAEATTVEDTEQILEKAIPGVEFVPAGMLNFETFTKYFSGQRTTFGNAHPNCESVAKLISDGTSFVPTSRYLKKPLLEIFGELRKKDRQLGIRLEGFEQGILGGILARTGLRKRIAKMVILLSAMNSIRKYGNFEEIVGPHRLLKLSRIFTGVIAGRKLKDVLGENTRLHNTLTLIVLPFEELTALESARLELCPAAFAYEDPETHLARTVPACAWLLFKNDILRKTTDHYGLAWATH